MPFGGAAAAAAGSLASALGSALPGVAGQEDGVVDAEPPNETGLACSIWSREASTLAAKSSRAMAHARDQSDLAESLLAEASRKIAWLSQGSLGGASRDGSEADGNAIAPMAQGSTSAAPGNVTAPMAQGSLPVAPASSTGEAAAPRTAAGQPGAAPGAVGHVFTGRRGAAPGAVGDVLTGRPGVAPGAVGQRVIPLDEVIANLPRRQRGSEQHSRFL